MKYECTFLISKNKLKRFATFLKNCIMILKRSFHTLCDNTQWIHAQILHRTTIMYFAIIRDSISKLKNVTNVRSNAIIIFILSFRLYVKSEKNSVSLIKVMLLFSALLKHFVWYLDDYLARQNTAWLHHENVFHCSTITFSWSDITNISLVWITLNNYVQFVFGNTIYPLS